MRVFYLLLLVTVTNVFSQSLKKNELLLPYRDGNLWGFCDTLGKVRVKPFITGMGEFAITSPNFKGRYVIRKNGKISIIDQNKKVLFPGASLDSVQMSNYSNVIFVYKNNKEGILRDNKSLIPAEYDRVTPVVNESFEVEKGGKLGLINSKGKLIIPIKYEIIKRARVENKDQNKFDWVAISRDGGNRKETIYTDDTFLDTDEPIVGPKITLVTMEESIEERDRTYNRLKEIEKKYGEIVAVSDDKVVIKNATEYLVYAIDKDKIILKNDGVIKKFRSHNGSNTFLVEKKGQFGLVDETGKIILDYKYDKIEHELGAVCFLEKENKKGIFFLNSIYKEVELKYTKIKILEPIQINDHWQFSLFEVTTIEGKKGLLGENGVEYFKN